VKLAIGTGNAGGVSTSAGRSTTGGGASGLTTATFFSGAGAEATSFGATLAIGFGGATFEGFACNFTGLDFAFACVPPDAAGFFVAELRDFVALPIAGHANVYEALVSNTTESCANSS
jgi:hypothetical protein